MEEISDAPRGAKVNKPMIYLLDFSSSESVTMIYLHKETNFVFDTSSVLCES